MLQDNEIRVIIFFKWSSSLMLLLYGYNNDFSSISSLNSTIL